MMKRSGIFSTDSLFAVLVGLLRGPSEPLFVVLQPWYPSIIRPWSISKERISVWFWLKGIEETSWNALYNLRSLVEFASQSEQILNDFISPLRSYEVSLHTLTGALSCNWIGSIIENPITLNWRQHIHLFWKPKTSRFYTSFFVLAFASESDATHPLSESDFRWACLQPPTPVDLQVRSRYAASRTGTGGPNVVGPANDAIESFHAASTEVGVWVRSWSPPARVRLGSPAPGSCPGCKHQQIFNRRRTLLIPKFSFNSELF